MDLPQEFKERIKRQLGDSYEDFLAVYKKERVCGLRYNPLKISREKLKSVLLGYGIPLEETDWAREGFYYPAASHPGKLPLHEAGAFYIQEPSAMAVAAVLDPKPGENILDLCAAPGGKSTHIAGRMQGSGLLVSNETVSLRAKILSRNIERMGISNALVLNESPEHLAEHFPLFFDRILVDAPCSGEGMFRKDENARGEWSLKQTELCAKRQREILSQAVRMLKPGGILVYSTCTFAPQENEEMAEWLVQEYPEFSMECSEHFWPHLCRGEGHYAARFQKGYTAEDRREFVCRADRDFENRQSGNAETGRAKYGKMSGRKCGGQLPGKELLGQFCQEVLSEHMAAQIMERVRMGQLAAFGDQLYLVPPETGSLDGLKTERAGLQLGCCKKGRFEPSHALAMALRPEHARQVLELEEPERYIRGETISCASQRGWTLVTVEGCSVGWGKASQGILKNHYPKGLRRS